MPRGETIRCRAILFDLDGVLLDSAAAVERAWERWAGQHGLDVDAVLAEAHGRRTRDTIRAVAPWLDVEAETQALEEAESADTDGVVALAGAGSPHSPLPGIRERNGERRAAGSGSSPWVETGWKFRRRARG